jgi:hypothetical protein
MGDDEERLADLTLRLVEISSEDNSSYLTKKKEATFIVLFKFLQITIPKRPAVQKVAVAVSEPTRFTNGT